MGSEASMQGLLGARAGWARALLLLAALAGCVMPRSGPTAGEIRRAASTPEYDMHVVRVTPPIAAASRTSMSTGFGSDFIGAGVLSPDAISPGDTLQVRVWENVDTGLLAGAGQKATALESVQVDQAGGIFVPYAGRIQAAGDSPDQLRQKITASLETQTPDPQVEVVRVAGDGATVSVLGGVNAAGVYPIDASTLKLLPMLARAGGISLVPDVAQVRLERRGRVGRVWLQDLYDNPSLDIALRSGDRIIVEEDRRSFTALGAVVRQARVPFNKQDMTAIEAIAASGGLDGRTANPTGVFVFRQEPADVSNRVLARSDLIGPQRIAYLIDLTSPEGLFSAREFVIRDEDTVYVTEAPLGSWTRILALATAAAVLIRTGEVLAN
jgi:polysaccharide export outer membrane protein